MENRQLLLRLNSIDNVVIATEELISGTSALDNGSSVLLRDTIPFGHKVATEFIGVGDVIKKYGQIIAYALRNIEVGEHVHDHNAGFASYDRDYDFGTNTHATDYIAEKERATFEGIVRKDGQVATRNYIGVITSVNCSSTVARRICRHFEIQGLDQWPNVDGVVALTHGAGCGTPQSGDGWDYLRQCITGYIKHPNIAGTLLIGLGCEANQIDLMMSDFELKAGKMLHTMTIQSTGGTRATIEEGIKCIEGMLPLANKIKRQSLPASFIKLGMECGGSDAFSGVTANPALGAAADLLVRHGGTAILGETPEIYGSEHLLVRRVASVGVGNKLLDRIRWWEDYTKKNGAVIDNNPSPGNKAGGLTTILEKSLGAAAKGGTSNLVAVYRYAEEVRESGFVFMDTPGYDPVSVTGMVAGGANLVCFTTGRGSVFGCKPSPSLKLATNTPLFNRMRDDMDVNCGRILDGEETIESLGKEIFELILKTASGQQSRSEAHGFGDEEFVPWQVGAVL